LNEIVYLFGAGVNQAVKDWDGLSPPLSRNLFQIALNKEKYSNELYIDKMKELFDYIEKYFKMTRNDLKIKPFDLEMCFTLLERQALQAFKIGKNEEGQYLFNILFLFKSFLAEVISDFDHFSITSTSLRNLGKIITYEKPTIITFNYDCIMEQIIESSSGLNPNFPESFMEHMNKIMIKDKKEIPDELVKYSHYNWNRPLGYGFKFDEIQLQQAGPSIFINGNRFYSYAENQLYKIPLLKLHGSLNWFRYLPLRMIPNFPGEPEPELGERKKNILLKRGNWWFGRPPFHEGWLLDPLIITPTLYKENYYDEMPFMDIWEIAKNSLSNCRKLIIVGYSFSPTDFSTKQLFLESFYENNLEELIVINPDHSILKIVKDLCHYQGGIIWFNNLDEYIESFSNLIQLDRESNVK